MPLPAETARELGIPGLGGLLCLVPLCFMMCRGEPLRSSGYGHMADGIGAEPAVSAAPLPGCWYCQAALRRQGTQALMKLSRSVLKVSL